LNAAHQCWPDASVSAAGLRRLIAIIVAPGEARGIVSDDFHHFRVAVRHEAGVVTGFATQSVRTPYTLCPAGGERLEALVGLPLTRRVLDIHGRINGRLQCTHQFDLAAMAIAAAARGSGRRYSILVTDPVDGASFFSLRRDCGPLLAWHVRDDTILSPDDFEGVGLRGGFADWVAQALDDDLGEAALALRRVHMIAQGRQIQDELDAIGHARPRGGCWAQQPERALLAKRIRTGKSDGLTDPELDADDRAWLGFS
jgi:hypothetical protein